KHSLRGFEHHIFFLHELTDDKRLKEFQRHFLGQTALMKLKLGSYHDHASAGVVHALTKQILPESALLSFKNIGKGLERPVAGAHNHFTASSIFKKGINGFLKETLFV